jgi:hypothetical protein
MTSLHRQGQLFNRIALIRSVRIQNTRVIPWRLEPAQRLSGFLSAERRAGEVPAESRLEASQRKST